MADFSPFFGKDLKFTVRFDDGSEIANLYGELDDPKESPFCDEYIMDKPIVPEIRLYSDEPITQGMLYRQNGVTVIGTPKHGRDAPISIHSNNPQVRYVGQGFDPYPDKHMFYVRDCGDVYVSQFYMPNQYLRVLQFIIGKMLDPEDLKEFHDLFPDWDETVSYYDYDIVSFDDELYQRSPSPIASIMTVSANAIRSPATDPGWTQLT